MEYIEGRTVKHVLWGSTDDGGCDDLAVSIGGAIALLHNSDIGAVIVGLLLCRFAFLSLYGIQPLLLSLSLLQYTLPDY